MQKRNNFKDLGVQNYGGAFFAEEVDKVNDVFDNLKPPPPSSYTQQCSKITSQTMRSYNNCYGGCFLPECLVTMVDAREKRCDEVRSGDIVLTGLHGIPASVLCVLKISGPNMTVMRFEDSGLAITPWHPMLVDDEWVFPAEQYEKSEGGIAVEAAAVVYNFVLSTLDGAFTAEEESENELLLDALKNTDHTLKVNGVPVVTFGHGLETNQVVQHCYWGNMSSILRDLRGMRGFSEGFIEVRAEGLCVKEANLVVKMVQADLPPEEEMASCKPKSFIKEVLNSVSLTN